MAHEPHPIRHIIATLPIVFPSFIKFTHKLILLNLDPEIIPGDKLFMMQGATLYEL